MKVWTMYDFLTKKVAVRCETRKDVKEFMKCCDELGLLWRSDDKASGFIPFSEPVLITFNTSGDKRLGFSSYMDYDGEIINWSDFAWRKDPDTTPKKYKVEIECDGTTTTAKLIVDGKEVKSATAKKHPDDKFNLKMGLETAFGRLWDKQKSKTDYKPSEPPKRDFQLGDRVIYVKPESSYEKLEGKHGRITRVSYCGCYDYGVEFDESIEALRLYAHNCGCTAKQGHGLFVHKDAIIPET